MSSKPSGAASQTKRASVFLNVPYDRQFQRLWLAYIAGISAFGLVPRATLEIPGGERRLDRILGLIQQCEYSVHDLSRVQLDRKTRTPRFNMPFELGLTIGWNNLTQSGHLWFAFEARRGRLSKSLSDLDGSDIYIHQGRISGVFAQLCNALSRADRRTTVPQMDLIYRTVTKSVPGILRDAGTRSAFDARPFLDICYVASRAADAIVMRQ